MNEEKVLFYVKECQPLENALKLCQGMNCIKGIQESQAKMLDKTSPKSIVEI
jgi:hypothetical protein